MLTYDPEVDAAYLTLGSPIGPGEVARTVEIETPTDSGTINADYDSSGRLLGFEFLNASLLLRPGVIAAAER